MNSHTDTTDASHRTALGVPMSCYAIDLLLWAIFIYYWNYTLLGGMGPPDYIQLAGWLVGRG